MKKFKEIVVITTGGTIEKRYNEADGSLENRQSRIKEKILTKLRLPHTPLQVFSLVNKDSLSITDEERAMIVGNVASHLTDEIPVVVLHGTDTMAQTAEKCLADIPTPPSPVVFTGAMSPMGFEDSDAMQNVAEALLAVQILPPGVYISFHNRVFSIPGAVKNSKRGTFEMKGP